MIVMSTCFTVQVMMDSLLDTADEAQEKSFLQARYGIGLALRHSGLRQRSASTPHRRSFSSSGPLEPTLLRRASFHGSPMMELPLNRPVTPKLMPSSIMASHNHMIRCRNANAQCSLTTSYSKVDF